MLYHENKYLNYHLTTTVNFDTLYLAALYCQMMSEKLSNWFYFLSNALCYIQIKFCNHKLISLSTTVENIHLKTKKSTKF